MDTKAIKGRLDKITPWPWKIEYGSELYDIECDID